MPGREKVISNAASERAGAFVNVPFSSAMNKAARSILSVCALLGVSAVVAACGGVPGNSVATVDGTTITKSDFDHWLTIAAKSSGQQNAVVPDPPEYTACIAAKRKATPKPAKGVAPVTDAALKTQCVQEYNQLRDQVMQLLIQYQWISGEADKQGIKVTDAEVTKSFNDQKKQSFPKAADYTKFLKQSGESEADIKQRVRLDLLSNKLRDAAIKGKDTVTPQQIADFYTKNKARFATPEKRDLRVVLATDEATANTALKALQNGESWKKVAKRYSTDDASKSNGGELPAQTKEALDKGLADAVFSAPKNKLEGPTKTQFGWYVYEVTGITPASQQTQAQAQDTIKQTLQSQAQQKALNAFVGDFTKRWRAKTTCSTGYKTSDCSNGPKPTPTPTATGQ